MQPKKQQSKTQASLDTWMTYEEVKELFNYRATQMCALVKKLVVSQVGNRKFITRDSVEKLLEQNKV
jgi:hypothetical protein